MAELERRFVRLGLTRESGAPIRTVVWKVKTHPGMLPQFRALEFPVADNREGQDETGRDQTLPYNIPEGRRPARGASRPQGQNTVRTGKNGCMFSYWTRKRIP